MTAVQRNRSAKRLPLIVVSGFMGTGKTSVGRALADILGLDFIDTDSEIERSAGGSIAEIFEKEGEGRFREMERAFCASLENRDGVVVATGGGTLLDDTTFRLFAGRGEIVLLESSLDSLCGRLSGDRKRPLLYDDGVALSGERLRDRVASLLNDRAGVYKKIRTRVDTSGRSPNETAAVIAAGLHMPCRMMVVDPVGHLGDDRGDHRDVPRGRYGVSRIEIGRGAVSSLGSRLSEVGLAGPAFLLMPETIQQLFLTQIAGSLERAKVDYSVVTIEDGDPRKNLAQVGHIIDQLIELGARRDAIVIPVGGGVTGDIGGFAASLFMRGVPLVQVPTTLLAQVDSSIGGKVGVNHPMAKNLIGSFYQPHLIINDPCTLRTLPFAEVANGMAEVVKTALIGSSDLFEYLEAHIAHDAKATLRDTDFLERCVAESAEVKCQIVNEDPYENGRRRALNLGHTVGHALEAATSYQGLKHGEAVSLGLIAALRISVARGTVAADILDRTFSLLSWCGLPVTFTTLDRDAMSKSLLLDKKIRNGRIHFVLSTGIGSTRVVDDVSIDEILSTIEER